MYNTSMRVLIVSGGNADEKEISLMSASNVKTALKKREHFVEVFDISRGLMELKKILINFDVIFPVLHGIEGEGGSLQKFLETNKIKFVGSGSTACKNSWNKAIFKKICDENKILTPKWFTINKNKIKLLKSKNNFVIKPIGNGSSVDVFIIKTKKDLKKINFKYLFSKYKELLIEDYIEGIEFTVGVLGNKVYPVLEIIPPQGGWFDYKNKYNNKTQEIVPTPNLNNKQVDRLQKITYRTHKLVGCKHFSRTDFIMKDNLFYILDLNTIPGLTKYSLFPKIAAAGGIPFEDLTDKLVRMAARD